MKSIEEAIQSGVYYSGSYLKTINGNKYGNHRAAITTVKVSGKFEDIYNYIEESMPFWVGRLVATVPAATPELEERQQATADMAQKQALRKEIGKRCCHYTIADTEMDLCDVLIIKGFLFFKTKIIIKLTGYSGYCKQLAKILKEQIKKRRTVE